MLAPDEVTEFVRPIEVAWLENLFVQARTVEPKRHGQLDVALERLIRWRGVDAVRIKALVEYPAAKHSAPV